MQYGSAAGWDRAVQCTRAGVEGREHDHAELIARALLGEEAFKDDHTTYLDSGVRGGCADHATQGSTVQGSTMQCRTAQYGAEFVQNGAVWYRTVGLVK